MKFIPLTIEEKTNPWILEPLEDTVYFLSPQTETTIHLNLTKPDIRAFLISLSRIDDSKHLMIVQNHEAKNTESHVLLRTILDEKGNFQYHGTLRIEKEAHGSIADQEARALMNSKEARFKAVPSLEILPSDVKCSHKASSSSLNPNSLYALEARGLGKEQAKEILEVGFLQEAFDTLRSLRVPEKTLEEIKKYC